MERENEEQHGIVQDLFEELISNILSRIPAEMLQKSVRFVCKHWAHVVRNPHFIEEHAWQAKTGLFFESVSSVGYANFLEVAGVWQIIMSDIRHHPHLRTIGSCDGVVLLIDIFKFSTLYVANPITKEMAMLPSIEVPLFPFNYSNIILCIPSTGEYKVVHACFCSRKCHWLVFTHGTDNAWRMFSCQQSFYSEDVVLYSLPVSIGQMIYWTGFEFQVDGITYCLVMDMEDETVDKVPIPSGCLKPSSYLRMGDCLAAFITYPSHLTFEICVLTDWHQGEWPNIYRIHMGLGIDAFPWQLYYCPLVWLNDDQVLVFEGQTPTPEMHFYIACDLKNSEIRFLDLGSPDYFTVFLHTNTLLSWETRN